MRLPLQRVVAAVGHNIVVARTTEAGVGEGVDDGGSDAPGRDAPPWQVLPAGWTDLDVVRLFGVPCGVGDLA